MMPQLDQYRYLSGLCDGGDFRDGVVKSRGLEAQFWVKDGSNVVKLISLQIVAREKDSAVRE